MTRRIIEGFRHVPGVHCGSTALADVVRHKGLPWSEAMCFGLGAGPAFYSFADSGSPSRVFHGRTLSVEEDFCRIAGLGFVERTEPDQALAWARVKARVDANDPVILGTDVRFLPYFGSRTSFNGHRVVLAGYDEAAGEALLADTEHEGLQAVALADLAKARTSDGPPVGFSESTWWEISVNGPPRPLALAVPEALWLAAQRALHDVSGFGGCDALDRLAGEMPGWKALPDFPVVARYGYQIIEKRGTGGGLFRLLYSRFLGEAAQHCPELPLAGLAGRMEEIAATWSAMAFSLRESSEGGPGLEAASAACRTVAGLERRFFEELRLRFPPLPG